MIEDNVTYVEPIPTTLESIIVMWESIKKSEIDNKHMFGYDTYLWITKEAAYWNVVNVAKRAFSVEELKKEK